MSSQRIEEFRSAAAEAGVPEAEVEGWLESVRLYVHLSHPEDGHWRKGGPVAGRKGGWPLLPADVEWPLGPSGDPLPFHALVDCAKLPRAKECRIKLPEDGYLLFFVYFDGTMAVDGDLDSEQEQTQLIYVPGGVAVEERRLPDVDPFSVAELTADLGVSEPDWLKMSDNDEYKQFKARVPRLEELGELAGKSFAQGGFGDRNLELGSYPVKPQDDPLDLLSEETGERREEWELLAQFGSEDPGEAATVARFFIRRADLAAGDFTRVVSCSEFME
jgi:uncharacterized protein YwqG